jgi:hypothetical protein
MHDYSYYNQNATYNSTLEQKIFSPSADGRSSPEFLALMCQLPTYSKFSLYNDNYSSGLDNPTIEQKIVESDNTEQR